MTHFRLMFNMVYIAYIKCMLNEKRHNSLSNFELNFIYRQKLGQVCFSQQSCVFLMVLLYLDLEENKNLFIDCLAFL